MLPGHLGGVLFVQGLRAIEDGAVFEGLQQMEPAAVAESTLAARTMAAALVDEEHRPVFRSAAEAKLLDAERFELLKEAVFAGLGIVSPSLTFSDRQSWSARLKEGAKAPFNLSTAALMADTADYLVGSKVIAVRRPERYFGVPPCELTDGHLMAFWAGVAVVKEARNEE